jgi:tRNA (guanine-N7-)-methyltransferase
VGKNKLDRFAEMKTYGNVFEPDYKAYVNHDHPLKGNWNRDYFNNDRPIVLELGCGKGEYTVGLAQHFPWVNFVGIDIKGARMWRGAKQAIEENLANVAFLRIRIETIASYFSQGEVSEMWITFPDPQEKERRKRKRLTSSRFLSVYRKFLKPGGIIFLKTDNQPLYEYTSRLLSENKLPVLAATSDLYQSQFRELSYGIQTYYEKSFLAQDKSICFIKFGIDGSEAIREPEE